MKWKINKDYKYYKWHKWFAWHPVKISEDEKIWFEAILRKQFFNTRHNFIDRLFHNVSYEYRESVLDILKD